MPVALLLEGKLLSYPNGLFPCRAYFLHLLQKAWFSYLSITPKILISLSCFWALYLWAKFWETRSQIGSLGQVLFKIVVSLLHVIFLARLIASGLFKKHPLEKDWKNIWESNGPFLKFFSYSEATWMTYALKWSLLKKFMKRAEQNKDVNFTIFEKVNLYILTNSIKTLTFSTSNMSFKEMLQFFNSFLHQKILCIVYILLIRIWKSLFRISLIIKMFLFFIWTKLVHEC